MKKSLIAFLIIAAGIVAIPATAFASGGALSPGNGGTLTPGLWVPNTGSSTITPNPSSLQVPCANIVGGCVSGTATSTINGVTGPTFTFSIVSTSSASSITTSSQNLFLNLLKYTSSSDITITSTGTIIFANHNISQFTNDSGYITTSTNLGPANLNQAGTFSFSALGNTTSTGNVSANTFTQTQTSTASFVANLDTILYANTTSTGDYGGYLNGLCASSLTNASGSTIMVPQENVTFSTSIVENGRCTFQGVGGNGTIWNWNGAAGTSLATLQFDTLVNQVGGGFKGITFKNLGSATTTNPIVAISMNGGPTSTNGGAHADIEWNFFTGFGRAIYAATGTYGEYIEHNTFRLNGQVGFFDQPNDSGESVTAQDNWMADQNGGNALNCLQFATNSVEVAFLTNNTYDNCQVHAGANTQVFITGGEAENTNNNGSYPEIVQDPSALSNIVITGFQAHNDGTSTSTSFSSIFQLDGNWTVNGFTMSKNVTASSVPQVFANTNQGTDIGQIFGSIVNQNGTSYSALGSFPWNNLPATTFNTTGLMMYHDGYPYGWISTGSNVYQLYADGGVAEVESIPAGGSNNAGYEHSFATTLQGSSTIDDFGTLGLMFNVSGVSTTITGSEAGAANGNVTYVYTGALNATDTFPLISKTPRRLYIFKNRGTGTLSIAASSTVPDFLWLSGSNASATTYSLLPGSSTAFQNDGAYWDQLWK